jgi:formate hydrogenlyase subunit 3/multisubunit Na+/H+ antiporter MnhD subunit
MTGSLTALIGILYATTENDLKTMLAHSSIEDAGIIVAGIGAYLAFQGSGDAVPMVSAELLAQSRQGAINRQNVWVACPFAV